MYRKDVNLKKKKKYLHKKNKIAVFFFLDQKSILTVGCWYIEVN